MEECVEGVEEDVVEQKKSMDICKLLNWALSDVEMGWPRSPL